ncbi:T9SS type A sorting domain-containing protein [Tamlana sp. I1]|uniref:T9SS type A sorting domain-containing protein n=1 Tax=Tamlana sp. I1 TaxID=2762061 RepID=UPI00188FD21C|nr:T9SS type A sorting domain-containing protein [Tamlana sp. I1]
MKKITLLLLFVGSLAFSQNSVTWTNYPANPTYAPGSDIDMLLDYTSIDLDYICIWVRELNAMGGTVNQYEAFTHCPFAGGDDSHPNSATDYAYTFPVSSAIPESSTLPSGNKYVLVVFLSAEPGQGTANGTRDIIISSTASTNDFNNTKLAAYYNSRVDAVVVNSSVSGDYAIYDLTGREIVNGEVSNEISTASLKSGLYILSTAQGVLKFVK